MHRRTGRRLLYMADQNIYATKTSDNGGSIDYNLHKFIYQSVVYLVEYCNLVWFPWHWLLVSPKLVLELKIKLHTRNYYTYTVHVDEYNAYCTTVFTEDQNDWPTDPDSNLSIHMFWSINQIIHHKLAIHNKVYITLSYFFYMLIQALSLLT